MTLDRSRFDVVVAGGGLAGLTFALQVSRESPEAEVVVVERVRRPLPEACHKVGESSVELASHYYGQVLGLSDYLDTNHLPKNGLRFFSGDPAAPIARRPEIGPSELPRVPSYQLDRGRLENDLRSMVEAAGVTLLEGRSVRSVELSEAGAHHRATLDDGTVLEGRWLIDASGRQRLISKQLDLRRPSPIDASASWFRIASHVKPRHVVPAEGRRERAWHRRDIGDDRWLSTNHFCGQGYWVWIIPLRTGYTSIGIVADAEHHPAKTFNKAERARAWLAAHEPVLAAHLETHRFEDFRVVHDYSYLTRQMISPDRWACLGEAAAFLDPLYSLGGDFLAMSASYTARCVGDDMRGELDPAVVRELDAIYLLLLEDASRTLSRNGKIFPHGQLFGAKLLWDFFNYWSFMCAHFFQQVWREDAATLARFRELGLRFYDLNTTAQRVLEAWAALHPSSFSDGPKSFVGLPLPRSVFSDSHLALAESLDLEATFAKMEADLEVGRSLVSELLAHALRSVGSSRAHELGRRIGEGVGGTAVGGGRPGMSVPLGERFDMVDALPRRARRERFEPVARDLERAVGRLEGDAPLAELIALARRGSRSDAPPAE
ncbi:MAG: tryptophan 7-halogenase [Deltaproteobacteria bacterium]|nr:tryptophan 7-halogenase [Deltaproteobacteria bacterium]